MSLHVAELAAATAAKSGIGILNSLHVTLNAVLSVDVQVLKAEQAGLEDLLRSLLSSDQTISCLSWPVRQLLGDVWTALFARGSTRSLLQLAGDLQDLAGSKSNASKQRLAAMRCLRTIVRGGLGRVLAGHLAGTQSVVAKITKAGDPELRLEGVALLGDSILAAGSAGVGAHSDSQRTLGVFAKDKSSEVRAEVAVAVRSLGVASNSFASLTIDSLLSLCVRGLDDATLAVRVEYATTMGSLLALSVAHTQELAIRAEKDKAAGTDSDASAPSKKSSNLAGLAAPSLTSFRKRSSTTYSLGSAMAMLSKAFARAAARDLRAAIGHAMATLLQAVAFGGGAEGDESADLKARIEGVLALVELPNSGSGSSTSSSADTKHLSGAVEIMHSVAIAGYVLRVALGTRLPERQQLEMVETLVEKCEEALVQGQQHHRAVCCLAEVAHLVATVGDATAAVADALENVLLKALSSKARAVRLEGAAALRALIVAVPSKAAGLTMKTLQVLGVTHAEIAANAAAAASAVQQSDNGSIGTPDGSGVEATNKAQRVAANLALNSLDGHITALMALMMTDASSGAPDRGGANDYRLPSFLPVAVLGNAKALAARQWDGQMRVAASVRCTTGGWQLLSGLMLYGAPFARAHIAQLFGLFRGAMRRRRAGVLCAGMAQRAPMLTCVTSAVVAMSSFVRANQSLLHDVPALATACGALLSNVVNSMECTPPAQTAVGRAVLVRLHTAVLETAVWLPLSVQQNHGGFLLDSRVREALLSLSIAHFVDGTRGGTSLLAGGGLLTLTDDHGLSIDSEGRLPSHVYRLRSDRHPGEELESLLSTNPLTDPEALASLSSCMSVQALLSCPTSASTASLSQNSTDSLFGASSTDHTQPQGGGGDSGRTAVCACSMDIRCTDAAVAYFGGTFPFLSSEKQDQHVSHFITTLNASQVDKPRSARNVLAAMLSACESVHAKHHDAIRQGNSVYRGDNVGGGDDGGGLLGATHGDCPSALVQPNAAWLPKARGLLCAALQSPQACVRRAAAQCLGLLCSVLKGGDFGRIVVSTLNEQLTSKTAASHAKAGAVFALACIRRTLGASESRFVSDKAVYEVCKQTAQPVRTWALHSWTLIIAAAGVDVAKYVKPTIALINAHLLADGGGARDGDAAFGTTMLCLSRLVTSLVEGLGPELSAYGQAAAFLAVWDVLRQQKECLNLIEYFALFQPDALSKPTIRNRVLDFVRRHLEGDAKRVSTAIEGGPQSSDPMLFVDCSPDTMAAAVRCVLRLAERSPLLARDRSLRTMLFAVLERRGREGGIGMPPTRIPATGTAGRGLRSLRASLAKRAEARVHDGVVSLGGSVAGGIGRSGPGRNSGGSHTVGGGRCSSERCAGMVAAEFTKEQALVMHALEQMISLLPDSSGGDAEASVTSSLFCEWFSFCRSVVTTAGMHRRQESDGSGDGGGGGADLERSDGASGTAIVAQELLLQARWQTKAVALSCLGHVVDGAIANASEHRDLAAARALNERSKGKSDHIVRHLEELVTVACNASTAAVAGSDVPTLQGCGLNLLASVVEWFAAIPDPDVHGQRLLQQYEAQFNATLCPALGRTKAPRLVMAACALGAMLLTQRVSSSARRIIGMLVPATFHPEGAAGDSADDDDMPKTEIFVDYAEAVKTRELIARLTALGRLNIAANSMPCLGQTIASVSSEDGVGRCVLPRVPPPDEAVRAALSKALAPFLPKLVDAWRQVTVDYALLTLVPNCELALAEASVGGHAGVCGRRMHSASLFADPADADELSDAYSDTWWIAQRAVASHLLRAGKHLWNEAKIGEKSMPGSTSLASQATTIVVIGTRFLASPPDFLSGGEKEASVIFEVIDTLRSLMLNGAAPADLLSAPQLSDLLHTLASLAGPSPSSGSWRGSAPGVLANAGMAAICAIRCEAFLLLRELLKRPKRIGLSRALCAENDTEFTTYHFLVEAIMQTLHECSPVLGTLGSASMTPERARHENSDPDSGANTERRDRRPSAPRPVVLPEVTSTLMDSALQLLVPLCATCPGPLRNSYQPTIVWVACACLATVRGAALAATALDAFNGVIHSISSTHKHGDDDDNEDEDTLLAAVAREMVDAVGRTSRDVVVGESPSIVQAAAVSLTAQLGGLLTLVLDLGDNTSLSTPHHASMHSAVIRCLRTALASSSFRVQLSALQSLRRVAQESTAEDSTRGFALVEAYLGALGPDIAVLLSREPSEGALSRPKPRDGEEDLVVGVMSEAIALLVLLAIRKGELMSFLLPLLLSLLETRETQATVRGLASKSMLHLASQAAPSFKAGVMELEDFARQRLQPVRPTVYVVSAAVTHRVS